MNDDRIAELRRTTSEALDRCLRWQRHDFLPSAVGSAGRTALGQTAAALVLGLDGRAPEVARRARAWLADSAERDEQMGDDPGYSAMLRAQALGLAGWLLDEEIAPRHVGDAVALHQQVLAGGGVAPADLTEMHLPDLIRDAVLAGRSVLGASLYQRFVGPAPRAPSEVTDPLELAGWLAHELTGLRPPPAWVSVGERVLRERLLDWVDRGHGVTAALWLWLVYGESGAALTPVEALTRGGALIGAWPEDPMGRLLRDALGDPVDLDLFAGFLSVVAGAALPLGSTVTVELVGAPPVVVVAEEPEVTTALDVAVRAALSAYDAPLEERLASAARGRLVAPDGETALGLERVRISRG